MSYVNKVFPFIEQGDFIKNKTEIIEVNHIYCPFDFGIAGVGEATESIYKNKTFNAYHVFPNNVYVLNETESVVKKIMEGKYGETVTLNVTEIDYMNVAKRIETTDTTARIYINNAYMMEDIITDIFVNSASVGTESLVELVSDVKIPFTQTVNINNWLEKNDAINEATERSKDLLNNFMGAKNIKVKSDNKADNIYEFLDGYLNPSSVEKNDGRELVPLLIGPTGVFKSATVKELCAKYNYRLVDFRVSFTSRLDYSGLFQMGEVDGQFYSYSAPMEELVTCSDGFREYCKKAYEKVTNILKDGFIITNKTSDGNTISGDKVLLDDKQIKKLEKMLDSYKEYMKTPVLFFDEITRCKDAGVEGILVQLLNQKKFNNMTLKGCKFIAATNLNLPNGNVEHDSFMDDLNDMYDVNTELDVAYANRFMPIKVLPEMVEERWFEWADKQKTKNNKTINNIHPIIKAFLNTSDGSKLVYNEQPILEAIKKGLTDNEQKAQTFPNYRTWEMVSDYMYDIDDNYEIALKDNKDANKEYKAKIINGLISEWAGEKLIKYLNKNGYESFEAKHGVSTDEIGDFLSSTLEANVPAMLIGPSSLGKTSRVNAYMNKVEKETGKRPIMININLAAQDTTDLMGAPKKISLVDYVGGSELENLGLGEVGKDLGSIVNEVASDYTYGMTDTITQRAPNKNYKDLFKQALKEDREVVLFFDEVNRCKNPVIMSAVFEVISDYRFAGVSFKEQKDNVKIVAACNMAHSEMNKNLEWGEEGDYSNAGSIDPALAARFDIFWKKNYDKSDVESWLDFMDKEVKEGKIDGIVPQFIKELSEKDMDRAIKMFASVEKRCLENAEPSTRALHQLASDIKSMRGQYDSNNNYQKSNYNGKLIFDYTTANKIDNISSESKTVGADLVAQDLSNVLNTIISEKDTWEPALTNDKISINGTEYGGLELMETLEALKEKIDEIMLRPLQDADKATLVTCVDTGIAILDACRRLDNNISDKRRSLIEMYCGEEFASEFIDYFNSRFGSEEDSNITIEMLEDNKLIPPFIHRFAVSCVNMTTDEMVSATLNVLVEFAKVHGDKLPSINYKTLLTQIQSALPTSANMGELLAKSGKDVDVIYKKAEESGGDSFILTMLKNYPASFTEKDINKTKSELQADSKSNNNNTSKRESFIL